MTTAERVLADRLEITAGQVVREIGWDEDCDDRLRAAVEEWTGDALADAAGEDLADAVLLWWREKDGDLFDALTDALTGLTSGGPIWLLTPHLGRDGYVEPAEIAESATAAGLSRVPLDVAGSWSGTRLELRRSGAA
ncbi:DUF3052 domain-containing protein [Streptomyces sp. NBC_01171]|uniref:DUF3052 domain-containing protein n=1 Tax=Streptomyces sp. NBC_01171 TaxID=2903757 RepID=UPI00386E56EB|nr:DUF3052 domain-containing protein [Streptomyces sp. NBC_01171]